MILAAAPGKVPAMDWMLEFLRALVMGSYDCSCDGSEVGICYGSCYCFCKGYCDGSDADVLVMTPLRVPKTNRMLQSV